ncbi:MAG: aminopeptidase N [Marinobacter sp.]|nr:aminopeptidase N [Marinobacter sp.]
MRIGQPQAIYLKDYQSPDFLVDHVDLRFELFEDGARVHSVLSLRRNPERNDKDLPLQLDGDGLQLESVAVDGKPLAASAYELDAEQLRIPGVPDVFELQVVTWIKPQENTRLEGLYKSSGMFCTQCEAEGFRCITYFPDRPDVMARYRTRIEADRKAYPVLLSNGNPVDAGELAGGRHFVTWEDPFPKPCYLFALVAGDLVEKKDSFTTVSGRTVDLRMYVEPRNQNKCDHAFDSLKRSMRWDEDVYGREYDLDIFMIVAVDDFNMGAMENKGLNIFNSSCVLASQDTATDAAYQRIEAIVAHEYFHNWSGNRVTCRDWFQLSLKEGFTVFRDAQFSADMGSPVVKRIEDATLMRTAQFAEDAGPMAHPVRPDSYIEISNFYTLTIYEKGAEVVRMIYTLLGPELFRKGSDLYFERHDGQAVTTDDFVRAMEDASGRDLSQFRLWYQQAGTPVVTVKDDYDPATGRYRLSMTQQVPATPGQPAKLPQHIPFALGLLGQDGAPLPLQLAGESGANALERVLELTEEHHDFVFENLPCRPVPSLLRHFSAPVKVRYDWQPEQLLFLMKHDTDGFNRWDAGQALALAVIQTMVEEPDRGDMDMRLIGAYRYLLDDASLDQALVAKMMQLPTEALLIEMSELADVPAIHQAREFVLTALARELRDNLLACYHRNRKAGDYSLTPAAIASRALANTALAWLLHIGDEEGRKLAEQQFADATNMTDQSGALRALVNSPFKEAGDRALAAFYARWHADPQVMEQWFSIQASSVQAGGLERVRVLTAHPDFDWKNPNKVRAVIGAFANQNLVHFHGLDGSGYRYLAEVVADMDDRNPQIAARLVTPLTRWRRFAPGHALPMRAALESIKAKPSLSKDVFEVVSKSLDSH